MFKDDRGRQIQVGDDVCVTYIDTGRGAQMWMHIGRVVSFGRSRVRIVFPSHNGVWNVGPECLRVVS